MYVYNQLLKFISVSIENLSSCYGYNASKAIGQVIMFPRLLALFPSPVSLP